MRVLHGKLTLISAPAGFGKTTLVSAWVAACRRPVAWLSLDDGDNDPARFLTYLIAALQTVAPSIGAGALGLLQSTQPPPIESILTTLLNDMTAVPDPLILVLDDYHALDSKPVDQALAFLARTPTAADAPGHRHPRRPAAAAGPPARPRPTGRAARRRPALYPRRSRRLSQPGDGPQPRERQTSPRWKTRTEGWIAGLQLAALSMQGRADAAGFIQAFTGSHRFVLDYLVEEVLQRQPDGVQTFLLRTSILDRLCGPLCDAVLAHPAASGQETLEYLEHANLFIVPLDDQRRWYRYHHLFADLLRQRLAQSLAKEAAAEYHMRASRWYEEAGYQAAGFSPCRRRQGFRAGGEPGRDGMASYGRQFPVCRLAWLGEEAAGRADPHQACALYPDCPVIDGYRRAGGQRIPIAGCRTVAGRQQIRARRGKVQQTGSVRRRSRRGSEAGGWSRWTSRQAKSCSGLCRPGLRWPAPSMPRFRVISPAR